MIISNGIKAIIDAMRRADQIQFSVRLEPVIRPTSLDGTSTPSIL